MRLHRMKRALIVATGLLLLGCSTGPQQDPAVGDYVLKTVNGVSLPTNLGSVSGVTTQVVNGSVFIAPDGEYQKFTDLQSTQVGTVSTEVDTGRWLRSGGKLTFTVSTSSISGAGGYAGILSGSTLTLTEAGIISVYEKTEPSGGFCSRCL